MSIESAGRVVRIFVSSPSDVAPERGRVQAVGAKLNREYEGLVRFETVLWEEHFYKADRSFQPQNQKPEACDILVSIFWTRIGTELPGDLGRMPNGRARHTIFVDRRRQRLRQVLAGARRPDPASDDTRRGSGDRRLARRDHEARRRASWPGVVAGYGSIRGTAGIGAR